MNTNSNPKLLKTTVSGPGVKFPRIPGVILGNKINGYVYGDLMDANAIDEFTTERISTAKREIVEDILQQLMEEKTGDIGEIILRIVDEKITDAIAPIISNLETIDIDSIAELVEALNQKKDSFGDWFSVSGEQLVLNIN